MYDIKEIYEAYTVKEAIALKEAHPEAIILGGGSDVLVALREGKYTDPVVISIYLIEDLKGVRMEDGDILIGALTSFTDIAEDPIILEHIPTLADAVLTVGGPQLRNIASIGGNISNGVPSADSATTLLAYDAIVMLEGKDGIRECPITEFYIKTGQVDIRPTEIVTGLKIKQTSFDGYYGNYFKYAMREAMDIATSTCSINVKLNGKVIDDIRAAYGVAAPIPKRVMDAEAAFRGKELTDETIDAFAEKVMDELSPRDSWRASKALRTHILKEITRRNLVAIRDKGGLHD
ncbi:xanthine dehydrogenase FAD-binding subunit XdhB [Peptoniphilus equinus]|uniref:Xanthine dehydrogenase FAD-binding subunit XdhB n=1 Tax=Peptoniphilus equinus TaxID=3016343 RepID=A0ABY7QU48_9FIRM|nr:xanthine dehydrogenase subunit XdhB [Peptoniphilus equinus]WBW50300.1 xanthine dehydrogenase FAD-binding subunit XdhB [Peptoniphilus equinus]